MSGCRSILTSDSIGMVRIKLFINKICNSVLKIKIFCGDCLSFFDIGHWMDDRLAHICANSSFKNNFIDFAQFYSDFRSTIVLFRIIINILHFVFTTLQSFSVLEGMWWSHARYLEREIPKKFNILKTEIRCLVSLAVSIFSDNLR